MKPPAHDASARQHSGEPASGLGPNDGRKDRLRHPDLAELDCEIAGLVDRSTQELRRRLLANSETHAHARETGTMYGEKRPNGWVRQSMGRSECANSETHAHARASRLAKSGTVARGTQWMSPLIG